MTPTLFIDANQYLDLYRMVAGKKLLDSLEEQKAYIFVSAQIVDEVRRNKLGCARDFFLDKLKAIQTIDAPVPDHLLGISEQETTEFRKNIDQAQQARKKLDELVSDTLFQISRSEDEVSKRLESLFDKAVVPSSDEMQRARERKERGNPPGKVKDALGDQITWEQLLTNCRESKCARLWIISRDEDYCVGYGKKFLLNPLLHRNLLDVCAEFPEIYVFDNLLDGITHFGKNAHVMAKKLPTEEEAAAIKKEIEVLPPLGWMTTDWAADDAVRKAILFRNRQWAATAGTAISSVIGPAVAKAEAGGVISTASASDTREAPKTDS